LWLFSYDELFTYPAGLLTFERWISSGLMGILGDRMQALWTNLQSLVAVNGLIFLLPLIAIGFWHYRRTKLIQLSILYLTLLLLTMSFIFPYIGARGAYFHSSAALMPTFWAVAPKGLELAIAWISVRRGWNRKQATRIFATTAVFFASVLSLWIFISRVLSPLDTSNRWGASGRVYQEIGARLERRAGQTDIFLANNPPGFTLNTGFDSIVIPNGGLDTLADVAERYQATWVVLEKNHPEALNSLYRSPESIQWLELSETLVDNAGSPVYIYRLLLSE
jgi:hypothetical protein